MTRAERDEVRGLAEARVKNHAISSAPNQCPCFECVAFRAVLRYVPPGDAADIEVSRSFDAVMVDIREGSAYSPAGARSLAHAIHAAADAAEES